MKTFPMNRSGSEPEEKIFKPLLIVEKFFTDKEIFSDAFVSPAKEKSFQTVIYLERFFRRGTKTF